MKKVSSLVLSVLFSAILFTGCVVANISDSRAVSGKGAMESYEFRTGQYNAIKVDGYFEIRYHAASSDIVKLEIQPNLKEYITVEGKNGELLVSTTRNIRVSSGKTPVLTVSTPALNSLSISGACNFITNDKITSDSFTINLDGAGRGTAELDVKAFTADVSGAGSFKLSGKADSASLGLSGAGDLDALQLQTRVTRINLSGAGSIKISCSETLSINASGMGSVEYRGSPSVQLNVDGLVSVKKVE
jgi:hypothetical protein